MPGSKTTTTISIQLFFALILAYSSAHALQVTPITGSLELSSRSTFYILNVANNGDKPVPLKISAKAWRQDADGNEIREETSDLNIFPSQFILKAHETRAVRVTPKSNKMPDVEKAYRLFVNQPDVKDTKENKPGININFIINYVAAFYITPKNPQSRLNIVAAQKTDDGFFIQLKNSGNAHTHLIKPRLTIKQSNNEYDISDLNKFNARAAINIFPNSSPTIRFTWPNDFKNKIDPRKKFFATFSYECEYCDKSPTEITLEYN